MKNTTLNALKGLGLEAKEAKIYLALLELGQATILQIAKKSRVNRASIYYIIDKMKQRGWVAQVRKGAKELFVAIDPGILMEHERQKVEEFELALPELKALVNNSGGKPAVRFFEGEEGVKAIYADTLRAQTEILNYANSAQIREHWSQYDIDYVAQRVKRGIFLRGIAPDDEAGKIVHGHDKENLREIRLVDNEHLNFQNEIKIYDNKIAMIAFGNGDDIYGLIIESRPLANTQRAIFEMAWNFAGGNS